jgi:hypothetical protein
VYSAVAAVLAFSLALGGAPPQDPIAKNGGFLPLSVASQLERILKCTDVYPLVADPYRAARMNGFYCVTGLRANFRVVKIFDSTKAAQDDTDLYAPIQTGGRKLLLGKNWFVFGLADDISSILKSKLIRANSVGLGLKDYTTKQDLCMGLSTAALESHFDDPPGEQRHLHDLEWLFKGGVAQVRTAINQYGVQLKKSILGDNSFAMEQDLALASLKYRPFCLAQKGVSFSQIRPRA